jgi:hypothetical protein
MAIEMTLEADYRFSRDRARLVLSSVGAAEEGHWVCV